MAGASLLSKEESEWVPELVWTLWRKEESLVPDRNYVSVIESIAQLY
jgi:hypothetical protein